jgi:hypothetical protein
LAVRVNVAVEPTVELVGLALSVEFEVVGAPGMNATVSVFAALPAVAVIV